MNIIAPDIIPTLGKCGCCGCLPSDHTVDGWPRVNILTCMGRHWKTEVVCWICGNVHQGRTQEDAVAHWNEGFMTTLFYKLPSDASDMRREHEKALP